MIAGRMRAWLAYAVAGVAATALVAAVVGVLVEENLRRTIWIAALVAYLLQVAAFALLLALREQTHFFLLGWAGGMLLRLGAVAAALYWATRAQTLPVAPLVLSLVGFVFLLLMLEPVFLRWDLRKR